MSTYEFQPEDYIEFSRIVQAERPVRHRTDYATGRPVVVPAVPEQVLPQRGEGRIVRVIAKPRKVDGVSYQVARVYAGKPLGTVTAILDDAVLVGKQDALFDAASTSADTGSMYDNDLRHA